MPKITSIKPQKNGKRVNIYLDEELKNKLEKQLQKKIHWLTNINENALFSQSNSKKKRIEILLDNNSFSFKKIISFLEENKNQGFTFKIIPKNTSFMIGSNSSNDRGEIIEIE